MDRKRKQQSRSSETRHELKTRTLDFCLHARIDLKHVPDSVGGAFDLATTLMGYGASNAPTAFDNLVSDRTLATHAMLLDQALDLLLSEKLAKAFVFAHQG